MNLKSFQNGRQKPFSNTVVVKFLVFWLVLELQEENKKAVLTNLLQDDLPWVEPLEVDKSKDEVEEGRSDYKDGQLPAQPGQQVEGLVLLGKCPNVVPQKQVLFPYIAR